MPAITTTSYSARVDFTFLLRTLVWLLLADLTRLYRPHEAYFYENLLSPLPDSAPVEL